MRTIGRHIRRNHPLGDYEAMCAICGQHYLRSDLTRNGDGALVCKDDEGDTVRELNDANRAMAPLGRVNPGGWGDI